MPFIAPAIPAIIGAAGSIGGGLLARRGGGQTGVNNPFSQLGMKDLTGASDFFSSVMKNPAEATATTTSDLGRQFQGGINQATRNYRRSGATGSAIAEAPFQLASAAKGQQILARMSAAKNLGELGEGAGKLGLGQFGLGLQQTGQNRGFFGDIGRSIGGFLTQPGGLSPDSILGKIFKKGPGTDIPGFSSDPSSPANYSGGDV